MKYQGIVRCRSFIATALLASAAVASPASPYEPTVLQSVAGPTMAPGILRAASDGSFYGVVPQYLYTDPYGSLVHMQSDGSLATVYAAYYSQLATGIQLTDVVQGSDGSIYASAWLGGPNGMGSILKVSPDGQSISVFYAFAAPASGTSTNYGGGGPRALILGNDGALYGVATGGGSGGGGTVFRLTPDGNFSVVANFTHPASGTPMAGGYTPIALAQGGDGKLYVLTHDGDTNNGGAVSRIESDGSLTVLHTAAASELDALSLVRSANGSVYGQYGLSFASTTEIFKITTDGQFSVLATPNTGTIGLIGFDSNPHLISGPDGQVYGFSDDSNAYNGGSLFRISASDQIETLMIGGAYPATATGTLENPQSIAIGVDGNLYGVASGPHMEFDSFLLPLPPPPGFGTGPTPAVSLSLDHSTIYIYPSGKRWPKFATLTWSSTGADSCELIKSGQGTYSTQVIATGGSMKVSPSSADSPDASYFYTVSCIHNGMAYGLRTQLNVVTKS
jgi:uncharacterized repeat protein (TIGR03803 family)